MGLGEGEGEGEGEGGEAEGMCVCERTCGMLKGKKRPNPPLTLRANEVTKFWNAWTQVKQELHREQVFSFLFIVGIPTIPRVRRATVTYIH